LYFRDSNLSTNKALIFHQADVVYFDTLTIYDNYWKFKCFNIEQVVISQLSSTFNNKLISLAQARFDNFTPTCTVSSPTQINHLTRKDYVDNNFVYKTGSVTENINGLKTFTNNTNFTASLLARTNLTLYEWDNQTGNTLTLLFPMKQTIALRVSSGTTMSVQLPALTTNERGMVFTFVKLSSNVNVTLTTGGLNNIYTLNALGTNTTTNTTLLSADKVSCTLAVGFFGALTYWIEVSPYSTFDRAINDGKYINF
jgi:hypothetical protein